MAADANPWSNAVGAWVPLADLLQVVERELGIPQAEAARALRHPLESYQIRAEVVGWGERFCMSPHPPPDRSAWVLREGGRPYRVSQEGWKHADWAAGTLDGYPVRVLWEHVKLQLPTIELRQTPETAKPERSNDAGGRPPKHDWDAFWIEVAHYAAANDLEPQHRQELQRYMEDWTASKWPSPPEPATIRARLAKLYKAREAARN
jgi:hypothetical protein